jgi:outer membrane protein assembly factor BamB
VSDREKQIFALRMAYIAGIFSLIVSVVMLLNYSQLVANDPLESTLLKSMVERLQEDTSNEALKTEIRRLDLMARSAYFSSQWQIRTGAYLLIGGIIIMVISVRVYYSMKAKISLPDSPPQTLDAELLVSRRWIIGALIAIFGVALLASYLSVDHLSTTYGNTELVQRRNDDVPIQQIVPADAGSSAENPPVTEDAAEEQMVEIVEKNSQPTETSTQNEVATQKTNEEELMPESMPTTTKEVTLEDYYGNFPSFRGTHGLGTAHQKNIPISWDGANGQNLRWKVKIPLKGYSSPIVWGEKVFVTGANGANQSVYCYALNTGDLLWEHKVADIARESDTSIEPTEDTGYAAPTAATDGKAVYAIFATGDLVCLDLNGNRIWGKNLGIPDNHYGHSSSLLVWENKLFIQFDTNVAGKVMALDAKSGELSWETSRTSKISWASPILAMVDGAYQLILASSPELAAYHLRTGDELWKVDCLSGEVGPSPGFYNGIVYAANEYATLIAIKPQNPPMVLWESNEYLPEVSSPVAINNFLYIATSYGVIACFDATKGELLWEYEAEQGFYASPVIADDKIFFLDMDGKMHIFSTDGSNKALSTPELGENAVSTPAFADGMILLRGYEHLYCIGN